METKEQAIREIKGLLSQNDNKLFMGLVHEIYGPLRGLNFCIKNPRIDEVLDAMDPQNLEMSAEQGMSILEKINDSYVPKNVIELNFKVWQKTFLRCSLMILPNELLDQAENAPDCFNSLGEAIKGVNKTLMFTAPLQAKDPFFFRTGII
jgi:hypothetical protein